MLDIKGLTPDIEYWLNLHENVEVIDNKVVIFNKCKWLDKEHGLCRYYKDRPKTCRDFEIGGLLCQKTKKIWKNRKKK